MKKEQQKLYQTLTAKEIVKQLQTFIEFYKETQKRIPLCMVAAQEYIIINEEREKNAKKKKNNINQT